MVTLDDPRTRAAIEAGEEPLPRMSFGDHLDELRRRLLKSVIALLVCIFGMLPFKNEVQTVIIEPYRILWRRAFESYADGLDAKDRAGELTLPFQRDYLEFCRQYRQPILDGTFPRDWVHVICERTGFRLPYELVAVGGIEDFWVFMMASFVFACVLASPVVIWQAWAFVAAGLYKRERRVFYRYFPFMMGLLVAGVLFGYFLALPYGLGWLIRMMVDGLVTSMLTVGNYFTFLFSVTAAMGLVFQLPLVMVALQRIGLVRHRTFVKHWRWFVMIICVLAAVLTPPDPFSMTLMATPTLLLYALGLVLTRFGRRHERPEFGAAAAPEPLP